MKNENKRLTVVVVGRNDEHHLWRSLGAALREKTDSVEILYVDDCSEDGSVKVAESVLKDGGTVLTTGVKRGSGGARNLGAGKATGEYVYFHDSDDVLTEGSVKRILDALEACGDPDVLLVPFGTIRKEGVQKSFPGPQFERIESAAFWPVGPWSAVFRRSLFVPFPENVLAENVVWHFLQFDRFETFGKVPGEEPVYLWDRTNPGATTNTNEYFGTHSMTLEEIVRTNAVANMGLKDQYISDNLRNIANMYDARHKLTKPWVREAWFQRFSGEVMRLMSGHHAH